jgi:protein TonB
LEAQENKKNQRIATLVSVGLHALIIGLLVFLAAWRAPDPPNPVYGIEVNLGFDDSGSGDIQPEVEPEQQNLPPQEEEQTTTEPSEEIEPEVEQPVATETESPVSIKKPKTAPDVKKNEEIKKPEPKPQPEKKVVKNPDPNALFNPDAAKAADTKKSNSGSHGDDENKTGDKGNPEGKVDAKALYGTPGGGGGGNGAGLDLAGWKWDRAPAVKMPENEKNGKIVFEIEVDENGEITKLRTIERGLSLEAEKICREELMKLTFSPTGKNVPPKSTGKVTFVVKSK